MMRLRELKSQSWAILWTIFVFILCNIEMPGDDSDPGIYFKGFDKLVHLGFFFVLTILLLYGKIRYHRNANLRWLTILKIVIISASIGGMIELVQWKFFTYRSAEWWDFGSDMIGVMMAVFSYLMFHKFNKHGYEKN